MDQADSTNSMLDRLADRQGWREGAVLIAAHQTDGRGQAGNLWFSDAGYNLLMSVLLQPRFLEPRHQFFLNQVVALAVAETTEHFLPGHRVAVKWPNDILLNNRKVAGLLVEGQVEGNQFRRVIAGIGLNVNQPGFPASLPMATSYFLESDRLFDLEEVRDALLQALQERYRQLQNGEHELIGKVYMKKLYGLEQSLRFRSGSRHFHGRIAGLSAEGKLIINTGKVHEVFGFKEVEFLRG